MVMDFDSHNFKILSIFHEKFLSSQSIAIKSTPYCDSTVYEPENVPQIDDESNNINNTYLSDLSYKDHYSDMSIGLVLSQTVSQTIMNKKQ